MSTSTTSTILGQHPRVADLGNPKRAERSAIGALNKKGLKIPRSMADVLATVRTRINNAGGHLSDVEITSGEQAVDCIMTAIRSVHELKGGDETTLRAELQAHFEEKIYARALVLLFPLLPVPTPPAIAGDDDASQPRSAVG